MVSSASAEPSRVLVLGGTGFLGSRIAHTFLQAGVDVTLLTRSLDAAVPTAGSRTARMVFGRPYDRAALTTAFAGVHHVVHALGSMNPAEASRDPSGGMSRSIPALVRVLDMVHARPGVGFTYLSSGGAVYGDVGARPADETSPCEPLSEYGISKLAAENYIAMYARRHSIPARIVRVANAYGPGQRAGRGQGLIATLLDAAVTGRVVQIYGDGSNVRDYIHVDDVAGAVVGLVALPRSAHAPLVVNVGTGAGHSITDVLRMVETASGRPLAIHWQPVRGFDVPHNVLDVNRLRSLIDWKPTPLPAGIRATYAAQARLSPSAARVRSA
jgi:UDP-glucose 4-epimerase